MKARLAGLALSLGATRLYAQQDSVTQVRALIVAEASSVDAKWAELQPLLRPDSGTRRADSSLETWKKSYDALVDSVGRRLRAPMVEIIIDPDGAAAQSARRRRGDQFAFNVSPRDRAVADSLRRVLERHGIHGADGEGDMYYTASGAMIRREAGRFLTRPLQELVDLWELEDRVPVGGDASLSVSWEELARRLAVADNLVSDYPMLAFGSVLRRQFAAYLNALLGDWDNSSGFSRVAPRRLLDSARTRLERYASEHPSSRGGGIVRDYLEVLRANNWSRTRAVQSFLLQAMSRAEAP